MQDSQNPHCKHLAFLGVILLLTSNCSATVCVVLVTAQDIVIGADSKGVVATIDSSLTERTVNSANKIVLTGNDRIIVACVGFANITRTDGTVIYNFSDWISSFHAGSDTSIDDFSSQLANETLRLLNNEFGVRLFMGTLPPLNLTQNPSLPVVTFYLAKIVNGSPRVLRVTIDIDWRNRFFQQPKVEVIFPNTNPREPKRLFMAWNSISECGIDRVVFKEMPTSTQDLYRSIYPKQINALLTDQALKSKDLIRLNRILVSLEISDNPGRYEYPILIYRLPRHGRAKLYKFEN